MCGMMNGGDGVLTRELENKINEPAIFPHGRRGHCRRTKFSMPRATLALAGRAEVVRVATKLQCTAGIRAYGTDVQHADIVLNLVYVQNLVRKIVRQTHQLSPSTHEQT